MIEACVELVKTGFDILIESIELLRLILILINDIFFIIIRGFTTFPAHGDKTMLDQATVGYY